MIFNYNQFTKLFEGGAAIKSSRPILEREVEKTVSHIKEVLFPLIGGGELDKDYMFIGSIGKKKNIDINYESDQKKTEIQEKNHAQL